MSPVWMIEGGATAIEDVVSPAEGHPAAEPGSERRASERDPAERRLVALAAAVREHESSVRFQAVPARPYDLTLYRRLRQICAGR